MKRKLPGIIILQSGKPTIEIEGKIYSLKRTYRRLQVAYQVAFCILAVLMILFLPDYLPFPFFCFIRNYDPCCIASMVSFAFFTWLIYA